MALLKWVHPDVLVWTISSEVFVPANVSVGTDLCVCVLFVLVHGKTKHTYASGKIYPSLPWMFGCNAMGWLTSSYSECFLVRYQEGMTVGRWRQTGLMCPVQHWSPIWKSGLRVLFFRGVGGFSPNILLTLQLPPPSKPLPIALNDSHIHVARLEQNHGCLHRRSNHLCSVT